MAFYLGQSGGPRPVGPQPVGPQPPVSQPSGGGWRSPIGGLPGNALGAEGIRASGPTSGFDPAYLQNLATYVGGLFAHPGGGTMSFNPLGNLSEISPGSGIGGTTPTLGEPLTWLQQALGGTPFQFTPQATTPAKKNPKQSQPPGYPRNPRPTL